MGLRRAPQHLSDPSRQEEYLAQVVKLLERAAPDTGRDEWAAKTVERAMMRQKGHGWPSFDVWASVLSGGGAAEPADTKENELSVTERTFRKNCQRLNEGELVDENFLFGRFVDRALREERFTLSQLKSYRFSAFARRRFLYGHDEALKWLTERAPEMAEAIERKRAAREVRPQHAADREQE